MNRSGTSHWPWWLQSLLSAILVAVIVGALLPTQLVHWRVLLLIAALSFAFFWWHNPATRYFRLAASILTLWGVSRLGSKLLLYLGAEQGTLAFAFENESSFLFDLSMGICLLAALVFDVVTREASPFGKRLKQLIAFNFVQQTTGEGSTGQTLIAQARDVHIYHAHPPSQQALDGALAAPSATVAPAIREGNYHDQIDAAVTYMKENKVDVAVELLQRLRTRNWDQMNAMEKYRTLANLGHCRNRQENFKQALLDFRAALTHQPSDVEARCFVAAAEFSVDNDAEARRLAEGILEEHPDAVYAHVVMLRTDKSDASAESLWNALPPSVQNAVPILVTLGWRAAADGCFDFARTLAIKGSEDDEGRIEFSVLTAAADVGDVSRRIMSNPPATNDEIEVLNASILTLNKAETAFEESPAKQQRAQVYYYLACAHRLLDNKVDAEHAYKLSLKAWPELTDVGRQYALFLSEQGRLSDAISVIGGNSHHEQDVESSVLVAHFLAERGEKGDTAQAVTRLQKSLPSLATEDLATLSNALNLFGLLKSREGQVADAIKEIDKVSHPQLTKSHRTALRAIALQREGHNEAAAQAASDALAKMSGNEDIICKWDIADACRACGMYSQALTVYASSVNAASKRRHIMAKLECADRSQNIVELLSFCEQLRSAGVLIEEAVDLETYYRETFDDIDGAISALDAYLALRPDGSYSKLVRLRKAVLGIKYSRPELLLVDAGQLPSCDEADGHVGRMVAVVLRQKGEVDDAIKYAYALLRRNFQDPQAHLAFVGAIGAPSNEARLPEYTSAALGCAVEYESVSGKERGWWILEELADPQQQLRELDPTHPTAVELLGKSVGDEFVLRKSGIQDVRARVVKIVSKYAYRYVDIFDQWQDRFPHEFFVWKVEMQKGADGEFDFTPIFRSLDEKAQHAEKLHEIYREHSLSIASFSVLSGVDAIDAVAHLASEKDLDIRCCYGNEKEFGNAIGNITNATEVVVCPSALATLWLTRGWKDLQLPFRLILPRSVWEQLRHKEKFGLSSGQRFLGKIGGQYVYTEESEEAQKNAAADFAAFLEWLKNNSEVTGGLALAELAPDDRDTLTQLFGNEAAQSIAIAKQRNLPLWTDDLAVAELSRSQYGVKRFWTEIALKHLFDQQLLDAEALANLVAILNGCDYRHTRLTPDVVITSARKAEWNPENWPFPSVAKWCQNPDIDPLGITQIVGFSLPKLWRTAPMPEQAEAMARSLLIAVRKVAGGDKILRSVLAHIDRLFGVDVLGADQCKELVKRILATNPRLPIILPGQSGEEIG